MKNKPFRLTAFLILLFAGGTHIATAQTDPHFTQNYTYPMYLNPALTGGSDGEYRISAIYRSKWGSVGNPYPMGVRRQSLPDYRRVCRYTH
jgi:hypothetical protein